MEPPDIELLDEDLEPLRRFMVGDLEGLADLDEDPENPRSKAVWFLFVSAFTIAVRWRFGESYSRGAVIKFVADLRVSLGKDRDELDPKVAEEWIRSALGLLSNEEQLRVHEDLDASVDATILILERLRDENVVGDAGLDAFLEATMDYARNMQEKLPSVWDEIRPWAEKHVPQGGGPAEA
ncbi:hypothetical protein [Actinomadura sp. SCN-SB]|uniref:hypothetical protein n=1 Tax=Actinomadura sp. SCN-SB TaxID=3373092 RepID=UPI00375332AB